jgi:DNA-3-methyladenine glycosylase II
VAETAPTSSDLDGTVPDAVLDALRRADPVLGRVIDAHPGLRPRAWLDGLPRMDVFGALLFQVVGQQLSVVATRRILGRIEERFDGRLPTPAELLAAPPELLRDAGLSRRKVATLLDVAARFADGSLSDELLRGLPDEDVVARLTAIPGIGPWTVAGVLVLAFDRPDVVLSGDLVLRKVVQRLYGLPHLPDPAEFAAISDRWRPYRSAASAYLFADAVSGVAG